MKVLVTGAHGFIGKQLVRTLLDANHEVVATRSTGDTGSLQSGQRRSGSFRSSSAAPSRFRRRWMLRPDAIIHLAAMSYSRDANEDPGLAWNVNAAGTARLLAAVKRLRDSRGTSDPLVIVASSAEVYGPRGRVGPGWSRRFHVPSTCMERPSWGPRSRLAQAGTEWDLRVIVVRPFPATGRGYQENRVLKKWIAQSAGRTGNR